MLPLRRNRSKYGAIKAEIDGIKFDSKKEAARYCELSLLQKAGEISDLKLQPKFLLIPSKRRSDGVLEREAAYHPDFSYIERGVLVVEDVKSKPTKTPDYVLRRKLMLHVHGVEVREIDSVKRKTKSA